MIIREREKTVALVERIETNKRSFKGTAEALHARIKDLEDVKENIGPGSPSWRLSSLLTELENRFPGVVNPHLSDPPEPKLLAAIDDLLVDQKKLTKNQLGVLRSMAGTAWHKPGWSDNAGWTWGDPSRTKKLVLSLVKRGLAMVGTELLKDKAYILTHAGRIRLEQEIKKGTYGT